MSELRALRPANLPLQANGEVSRGINSRPRVGAPHLFLYTFVHLPLDVLAVTQELSERMLQIQKSVRRRAHIRTRERRYLLLAVLKSPEYLVTSGIVRGQRLVIHISDFRNSATSLASHHYAIARRTDSVGFATERRDEAEN